MTTTKNSATTASKLASSVRRAKTTQTDEEVSETKATSAAKKTPAKKPAAKPSEKTESIQPMRSNRVWPD
ncbi:hypothetical protein P8629_05635 [Hydrogenovibrio sp. 3SP14C1]|uniref:hypothetical protein n=1 Tax=Hydrogenovibrio sp. 3SP14C1 TaxID=3038774 RepID=UPI00241742DC|nr:hypothetical protein [Hydrogenovibrio sp. 3SP14C1]MDG4812483.1 hypothetical protein [Hydrogenovibrio sp. 3SP14C1]